MSDYTTADLQERVRARTIQPSTEPATTQAVPVHPVVQMQNHLGNARVSRLIAQRHSGESELQAKRDRSLQRAGEEDELQAKHDTAVQRAGEEDELQAKHDRSLQRAGEEEEVQAKHDRSLQRAGEDEEMVQGKHEPSVQRKARIGLEGGPVGDDMAGEIDSARGGGSALDSGVRSQVEGALGADFSNVRVHQDARADQLNRSMTAKAFTTGSDIFLRGDANASDTNLMAHELTHVVQQSSGAVGGGGGGMSVGAADDSHEHEADSVAQSVTSGAAQRQREESLTG